MNAVSILTMVITGARRRVHRLQHEAGLETVEYALIAALVAVVAITTITLLGGEIDRVFTDILTAIQGATPVN